MEAEGQEAGKKANGNPREEKGRCYYCRQAYVKIKTTLKSGLNISFDLQTGIQTGIAGTSQTAP